MRFVVGRNNLAATIFVPYDCGYNCPFCTTKHEYADMSSFSLEKIIEQIKIINRMPAVQDVVFTGGEPFADLISLQLLINAVDVRKSIYINTTLPIRDIKQTLHFISKNRGKISGLNVSRHIDSFVSNKSDIALGELAYMPIRINCVLSREYSDEELKDFIEIYKHTNRVINFRADYRHITFDNLKTLEHKMIKQLLDLGLFYVASNGCLVCNTDYFTYHDDRFVIENYLIVYHRGIERSSVRLGETIIVNDIIIKQDGSMRYDWDLTDEVTDIDLMIKTFATEPVKKVSASQEDPGKIVKASAEVKKSDCYPRIEIGKCHASISTGGC